MDRYFYSDYPLSADGGAVRTLFAIPVIGVVALKSVWRDDVPVMTSGLAASFPALLTVLVLLLLAAGVGLLWLGYHAYRRRKQDQQAQAMAEQGRIVDWEIDAEGTITYISPVCEIVHGYTPSEIIGKKNFLDLHPKEGKESFEQFSLEGMQKKIPFRDLINPIVRKDGEIAWLCTHGLPILDDKGELLGYCGQDRDVTNLQQGLSLIPDEQRFGQMLDNLDMVAVQSYTPDGTVFYWNKASERMYGYTAKEAIGQNILDLIIPAESRALAMKILHEMERSGRAYRGIEIMLMRKDGTKFPAYTNHSVVERAGQPPELFGINVDLSDRDRAEKALQKAKEAAETASLLKSEFLANMSHEIRTPMTAILGYADLLRKHENQPDADSTQRMQWIETIKRNGDHLLELINDILDLSRIEADKLEVERVPTDLLGILKEVLEAHQPTADKKHVQLNTIFATRIAPSIQSDPMRLKQILFNLINNAVKFTEKGTVTVTVSMQANQHGEMQVQIEVADTGIGINSSELSQLFQPFRQVDASATRRFGGTGLGLRVSKRLAELLGGQILATSDPGIGTVFTVYLPTGPIRNQDVVAPDDEALKTSFAKQPDTAKAPPTREIEPPKNSLEGLRILLAEDSPDSSRLISFYLSRVGAEVTIFENGRALLDKITESTANHRRLVRPLPADLIITDIQMPEIDGYTLTRTLRELGCTLPILALTAHAMAGDAQKCYNAGCNGYEAKPINPDKLLQTVCDLCAQSADSNS